MKTYNRYIQRLFLSFSLLAIPTLAIWAEDKDKPATKKDYGSTTKPADVTPSQWKQVTPAKLTSAEVDKLFIKNQKEEDLKTAGKTSDEIFLRRVYLDLVGKLPEAGQVVEFTRDKASDKRSKVIDVLLASEDFSNHWADYWRDVTFSRATEQRARAGLGEFEKWLTEVMQQKKSWKYITQEMITANGKIHFRPGADRKEDNPASFFLLTHSGADAVNERAAETSRVFLGIQIQCAQCHDHPSDIWKRENFHQLAAFYARTKDRPFREDGQLAGIQLYSSMFGEHQMPDLENPKKTVTINPKFITGEQPASKRTLSDEDRRKALSGYVTSGDNYWFHANFVNRVWAELMGQGFYNPVDNMGPLQEATYPEILIALANHFRTTDTDIRDMYRLLMNTEVYQRQSRIGDSPDQHLHFSGAYPSRLSAEELWNSLTNALGGAPSQSPFAGAAAKAKGQAGQYLRRFGFEGQFKQTFAYDPTLKQDEVESSIPQALMLMNNPGIQSKLRGSTGNVLEKVLTKNANDREAVTDLYLRTFSRKPTGKEMNVANTYIQNSRNRKEAYEDLFWVMINSAEFQTKR